MFSCVSSSGFEPPPVVIQWCTRGDTCLKCALGNMDKALDRTEEDATRLQKILKSLQRRVLLAWSISILLLSAFYNIWKYTDSCKDCSSLGTSFFAFLPLVISYAIIVPLMKWFPKELLSYTLSSQNNPVAFDAQSHMVINVFGAPTYQGTEPREEVPGQCFFRSQPIVTLREESADPVREETPGQLGEPQRV